MRSQLIRNICSYVSFTLLLLGCSNAYYGAMEKIGYEKRDILVNRVEAARDTQSESQEEFIDALEAFKAVVKVEPSELENRYQTLEREYERSVNAADEIKDRIDAVESVAKALFSEWQREIGEYSNDNLRRTSQDKLDQTERTYERYIRLMRSSEDKLDPVLAVMKDQVLFLKHNLNAQALSAIESEAVVIDDNVQELLASMSAAISEADVFINALR